MQGQPEEKSFALQNISISLSDKDPTEFKVQFQHQSLSLKADSEELKNKWIDAIQKNCFQRMSVQEMENKDVKYTFEFRNLIKNDEILNINP